jgi:uncharacterized protein (DUF433 family)
MRTRLDPWRGDFKKVAKRAVFRTYNREAVTAAPDPTPEKVRPEELPRYSISEAAQYLRISPSTLSSWIRGRPYPVASGTLWWDGLIDRPDPEDTRLSFFSLIEAYVLNALRKQYRVPIPEIRTALVDAEKRYQIHHLLRSDQLRVTRGNLFLEYLGQLINVGRRQVAMPEILEAYLERIEWNPEGFAAKLSPITREEPTQSPKVILIDPQVGFGKPVVRSKGIKTSTISERFLLGESVKDLAEDYEIDTDEVEEAIRYERPALAA